MFDRELFKDARVRYGMLFTFIPMVVTSGFELLLSQELQLVHSLSPTRTAFYIIPFFLAFALSGAMGGLLKSIGIMRIKIIGLILSATSFFALSQANFAELTIVLVFWLLLLGFGLGIIMLAASYSIMLAAKDENAGTAGSLESVSYEMGVGLGVTFFGVLLSQIFSHRFRLDGNIMATLPENVSYSINDALVTAEEIGGQTAGIIQQAALPAYQEAHSIVLSVAGILLSFFAIWLIIRTIKQKKEY